MDDIISIIVLSYMNGEMLVDTIDSILNQDYPAIELIICDDASPIFDKDYYIQYINDHKKCNIINTRIVINENNVGTVKNLNNGIKIATGTYIKVIAGDDCIASNDVFSKQIQYLINHPKAFLVVGNIIQCDENLNPQNQSGLMIQKDINALLSNQNKLLNYICKTNQNALASQAICYRKSFFDIYGLYDERFRLIEDLPMAVRIVKCNVKFGYINYPCVKHRIGVGTSSISNPFDRRKLQYYEDLENYFRYILMPIRNDLGELHIIMRYKVATFRVEYCKLEMPTITDKIRLGFKYCVPLLYYFVTNNKKVFAYLKHKG